MGFKEYYQKEIERYGGIEKYVLGKAKEKKPLLDRVLKYAHNNKILEAGAGSASNSIFLSNLGYEVISADIDPEMLGLAKNMSNHFARKPKFINSDIEEIFLRGISVVFSHGVLEHFNDKKIIELVNKELELGDYVVFSVPSDFFGLSQAINGDERFMSVREWKKILSKTKGKVIEKFSYFYDTSNLKSRLLKFLFSITRGVLPIKKPYIGFVIKENVHNT